MGKRLRLPTLGAYGPVNRTLLYRCVHCLRKGGGGGTLYFTADSLLYFAFLVIIEHLLCTCQEMSAGDEKFTFLELAALWGTYVNCLITVKGGFTESRTGS